MKWRDDDNCYYNKISIKQIKKLLIENQLPENQFSIRAQKNDDMSEQFVLEIDKTK